MRAIDDQSTNKPNESVEVPASADNDEGGNCADSFRTNYFNLDERADPFSLKRLKHPEKDIQKLRKSKTASSSKVAAFYSMQNAVIEDMLRAPDFVEIDEESRLIRLKIAIYGSVIANVALFVLQVLAAVSSKSISLYATAADAFMDLASSSVILYTGYAAGKDSPDKYPTGKRRLETAGIIVFSSLMSALSLQLIIESLKSLAQHQMNAEFDILAISCVSVAIIVKSIAYIYCFALRQYPTANVFAIDHRNDIVLNIFGLTLSTLGTKVFWWLDPVGGIFIALLILRSWSATAGEHIKLIVGRSASPHFLQRVTYIALTHDPRILEIDTVKAYHSGNHFYVEVDIVLPPSMILKDAHDIGENLQMKLETIPLVERAFVHLDYETTHAPEHAKSR